MADQPDTTGMRLGNQDGESVEIHFEEEELQTWLADSRGGVLYGIHRRIEFDSPAGRLILALENKGDLEIELVRDDDVVDTTENVFWKTTEEN